MESLKSESAGDVGGREVFLTAAIRERGLFGGLWLLRRVYELICAGGVLVELRERAGIRSRPRSAASFRRASRKVNGLRLDYQCSLTATAIDIYKICSEYIEEALKMGEPDTHAYIHQQFALHEQTLKAQPQTQDSHTKPQSATPKSLAPGSPEQRTVLWVRGNDSRSIIPGDSNCWRKLRWGICDCAVG